MKGTVNRIINFMMKGKSLGGKREGEVGGGRKRGHCHNVRWCVLMV